MYDMIFSAFSLLSRVVDEQASVKIGEKKFTTISYFSMLEFSCAIQAQTGFPTMNNERKMFFFFNFLPCFIHIYVYRCRKRKKVVFIILVNGNCSLPFLLRFGDTQTFSHRRLEYDVVVAFCFHK
jgi:hypothetical protein